MANYRVSIRAKPGAKKAAVTPLPATDRGRPAYQIAVTEPALDGRANRAIERALAQHLGLPASGVRIIMGGHTRDKVAEVNARPETPRASSGS